MLSELEYDVDVAEARQRNKILSEWRSQGALSFMY